MNQKAALSLLFDRPKEPIFKEKGENGVIFEIPKSFVTERFQSVASEVMSRFGDETSVRITITQRGPSPDIKTFTDGLARDAPFSVLVPKHSKIAGDLIKYFMSQKSIDDLLSAAVFIRDCINPQLFNYALSTVVLHRKDTKGVKIPSYAETFPELFMDPRVIRQARETVSMLPEASRSPIVIPVDLTDSKLDTERKLWYFREDIGANLHHWHWHVVYPFDGDPEFADKHRRGELFYFMHQQIGARYNAERLSNGLRSIERFSDFRAPIAQGYSPKLSTLVANRAWPSRPDEIAPKDVVREVEGIRLVLDEMETSRDRFIEAIEAGFVINQNDIRLPLDEYIGIDILGNMMESSVISPNREYFGNLHNAMHNIIAYSHDPDHRHLEHFGVIGDATTAMRDPVFYRIHTYIDDLFQLHKAKLVPYTTQELGFEGVTISSLLAQQAQGQPNALNTFWQQSDVNLSRGLDFSPRGDVFARVTHLQHAPFTITLTVNNDSSAMKSGTCRLFMAPKLGYDGKPLNLNELRTSMIEIDKFVIQISPGENTIIRRSSESNVTIPHEQTFRNLDRNRPEAGTEEEAEFNICGCGWPNHLLIPKGNPSGLKMELFAMISDFEGDRVDQDLEGECTNASSYCGIRDSFYPDNRAMGFPFDRLPRQSSDTLTTFLTPNMKVQEISIFFEDKVTQRTRN